MNKTIYIRSNESDLWEKARKLSEGSLSIVIVKALKAFVKKAERNRCKSCGQCKRGAR